MGLARLDAGCFVRGSRSLVGARGRERALSLFSQQRVVDDTYMLYEQLLSQP